MSAKTLADLEDAIQAHFRDGNDDSLFIGEWVIMVASQFMDPDKTHITNYSWACTKDIAHGHLLGLVEIGTGMIKEER